jgi:glucosyl-dolichyl phosphate glucuronosyltransferase
MNISVVVCTFNRSKSLSRMLNSLREAVVPDKLSCEFIVIDNNSDDNTRFVIEEIEKNNDLKLRYVFEEKRGLSNARNRGIMEARGEIIAFTDDDVIVDKHWIQNIYMAFKEHDEVVCVGGKILPIWESSKPEWLNPSLYVCIALLDFGDSVLYMDSPYIWGANFAVKSYIFKKYGLFDSNRGRIPGKLYGGEETEFLQRLLNANEKILYYPSSIIYHCVSEHRMSKKYFRKWKFDMGELRGILSKNMISSHFLDINFPKKMFDPILSGLKIGCFSKHRFNHELRICYILGYISGIIKRRHLKS